MSENPLPEPEPGGNGRGSIPPDPREFLMVKVKFLVVDKRYQRLLRHDKVGQMQVDWDWNKAECPTTARIAGTKPQTYRVIEGQHRVVTLQLCDPDIVTWICVVPDGVSDKEQARLGHDISRGRAKHDALELWEQRLKAGDPHEVLATAELDKRGLRLGRSASPNTIVSVDTVRRIVHGGGFTPEYGSQLLGEVVEILSSTWTQYDKESTVNRWDRFLLRVVAAFILNYGDILDRERLVEKLRTRSAKAWRNNAVGTPGNTYDVLYGMIKQQYNHGLRSKRLEDKKDGEES
jgi:hypothetical protein